MTRNPEFRIGHFGEMSGGLTLNRSAVTLGFVEEKAVHKLGIRITEIRIHLIYASL